MQRTSHRPTVKDDIQRQDETLLDMLYQRRQIMLQLQPAKQAKAPAGALATQLNIEYVAMNYVLPTQIIRHSYCSDLHKHGHHHHHRSKSNSLQVEPG